MKVLYLTNVPAPYRVSFFDELGKYCELTVLYERHSANDRNEKWEAKIENKRFKEIFLKGKLIGTDTAICFSVLKYLDKKKYDIIVVGGYYMRTAMIAMEYMKIKKISFILNSDGGFIKNDSRLLHILKSHFIKSSNYWLSTGMVTNKYLQYYGADLERTYIYPFSSVRNLEIATNILNEEKKNLIKSKLSMKEEKVILSVGQFIHRKGFDVLLKASKSLNGSIGVYIIGGVATEEYEKIISELNINNVHFINFKTKQELEKYYLAADLFVLPTREDIWGLVINEAMSYGLPIVTTDRCIAGIELVKDDINGYIVPIDNYIILAEKINIILGDKKTCIEMSNNSLSLIKDYTIENMVNKHLDVFDFIINSKDI